MAGKQNMKQSEIDKLLELKDKAIISNMFEDVIAEIAYLIGEIPDHAPDRLCQNLETIAKTIEKYQSELH